MLNPDQTHSCNPTGLPSGIIMLSVIIAALTSNQRSKNGCFTNGEKHRAPKKEVSLVVIEGQRQARCLSLMPAPIGCFSPRVATITVSALARPRSKRGYFLGALRSLFQRR